MITMTREIGPSVYITTKKFESAALVEPTVRSTVHTKTEL